MTKLTSPVSGCSISVVPLTSNVGGGVRSIVEDTSKVGGVRSIVEDTSKVGGVRSIVEDTSKVGGVRSIVEDTSNVGGVRSTVVVPVVVGGGVGGATISKVRLPETEQFESPSEALMVRLPFPGFPVVLTDSEAPLREKLSASPLLELTEKTSASPSASEK